ncbi:MAG: hypothetical protein R3D80_13115 [Paracoccaceae bacterium]
MPPVILARRALEPSIFCWSADAGVMSVMLVLPLWTDGEALMEDCAHQERRGDENDDQRLDDPDQVDRHAGVHLHLPPAR